LKRSARALAGRPVFTIIAITTLALGLGVNTAVFSLTRTVLLSPLPYRDGERLVQVNETNIQMAGVGAVAPFNYLAWRERVTALEDTTYFRREQFNVSTGARAVQTEGFLVAPNFFPLIGIDMARGRGFAADAGQPGRDNVVVLSDGFWRRVFDGDPAAVGRAVTIDGTACTIAGVLPPSYRIFHVLNREVDVYRPLVIDPTERTESLNVWGKLKPGVPVETADSQLKTVYATLPLPDPGWSATAWLLSTRLAAGPKPVLVALEWAVALVLLIACANVANLVLAASAARRTELAVRQALGASRPRIARDLGGETLLIVAAGAALAVLIAVWVVDLLNGVVSFQDVNRLEPFRVDRWVLAFTVATATAVALLFGVLPARTAGGLDLVDALKDTSHGATAGLSNRRLRRWLIVAEVALAIVLAVAAVALTRSAMALHDLARGVTTDGVTTAQFSLNDPRYGDPDRMVRVTTAIVDRLRQSPTVDTVALVNYMPLSSIYLLFKTAVEGVPPPAPDRPWLARYFVVSPGYLRAAGIPLIAGRDFTAADDREHAGVAIASEMFARRFWNTTDVIGRRVTPDFGQSRMFWIPRSRGGALTIVGVVRDVREDGRQEAAVSPQIYVAYAQHPTVVVTLVARTAGGPLRAAAAAMRDAVHAIDPDLPLSYEMTFDEIVRETFARPRELAWLIGSFAALALTLAAIGVYGVMAFLTTARRREIGIRMALGASPRDVVGMVVGDAMKLAAAGIAAGLAATPVAFRFLSAAVYGVAPWNPVVLATVSAVLAAVCAAASALPAWRAARTSSLRMLG
jgi:putative ABC transport system permease protein